MRVLVLLLVVVNLGYFGWQYGQRFETGQEQSALYADGVPRLLLLSEPAVVDEKSTVEQEPDGDDETPAVPEAELAVKAPEVSDSLAGQRVATLANLAVPEKVAQAPVVAPLSDRPTAQDAPAKEPSSTETEDVVAAVETPPVAKEVTAERDAVEITTVPVDFTPDETPELTETSEPIVTPEVDNRSEPEIAESLTVQQIPKEGEPQDTSIAKELQTYDSTKVAVATLPADGPEVPMQEPEPSVTEPAPASVAVLPEDALEAAVCRTFGPLPSEEEAQRIQAMLENRTQRIVQRVTETEEVSSWWVVVPRPAEREARRALMKGLRESGLKDIWSITRGDLRGNVSLGIYGYRPNAERARDKAVSNGFVATIEPRVTTRSHYWLDMVIANPTSMPEPTSVMLEAIGDLPEGASLKPTPCEQIVAAPTSP